MHGDGIIDVWAQQPTERFMRSPWLETLLRWTGTSGRVPVSVDATLQAMDDAGVTISLLSAWSSPQGMLIDNDDVATVVDQHPSRFRGLMAVDLRDPMTAVREIRRRADDLRFVGVRLVPWVWDLPPNDPLYFPVYVACIDADLPFCTQIGHTGPLCRSEPGRPIPYLDDVLLRFPELRIVGGHVGYPWIDEVISLATKYPNLYVDTSAYAAHRLPDQLVAYMAGHGAGRVLFGTNWPMLSAARCLERIDDLHLDDTTRRRYLTDNARHVFTRLR